jgi:hypothetical protein
LESQAIIKCLGAIKPNDSRNQLWSSSMLATRANLPEVVRHFFTQKWPLYRPFACLFICLFDNVEQSKSLSYSDLFVA